jgi:hypothetical protein
VTFQRDPSIREVLICVVNKHISDISKQNCQLLRMKQWIFPLENLEMVKPPYYEDEGRKSGGKNMYISL